MIKQKTPMSARLLPMIPCFAWMAAATACTVVAFSQRDPLWAGTAALTWSFARSALLELRISDLEKQLGELRHYGRGTK